MPLTCTEHANNRFLCPLASGWVKSMGSTGSRLKEADICSSGSLLVGSLKPDGRPKLLSGGTLHPACLVLLIPSSPVPSGLEVLSLADADLGPECYTVPCAFASLVTSHFIKLSQVTFFFFFACMSSTSCIVLSLEPLK